MALPYIPPYVRGNPPTLPDGEIEYLKQEFLKLQKTLTAVLLCINALQDKVKA